MSVLEQNSELSVESLLHLDKCIWILLQVSISRILIGVQRSACIQLMAQLSDQELWNIKKWKTWKLSVTSNCNWYSIMFSMILFFHLNASTNFYLLCAIVFGLGLSRCYLFTVLFICHVYVSFVYPAVLSFIVFHHCRSVGAFYRQPSWTILLFK